MPRLLTLLLLLAALPAAGHAQSRVKDVATVHGSRANQLIGYGVVVGLNGTGDSDAVLTRQTLANLLRQFGLAVAPGELKARNVAVVAITATIPAFARTGSRLDVAVSSLADAKSLSGGTLLQAPLMGADGRTYAVAQGPLLVGGFFAGEDGAGGSSVARNHPTAATLPGGALVEAEIPTDLFATGALEVVLREADFTSAVRLAGAINQELGPLAAPLTSSTVRVLVPEEFRPAELQVEFVARVENVLFRPDVPARIVINERTGTVVANSRIRIDAVAVAHGNLTISITRTPSVSQPNPFTGNAGVALGGDGGDAAAAPGVAGGPATPLQVGGNYVWAGPDGTEIQLPPDRQPPPGFTLRLAPPTAQAGVGAPGGPGGAAVAAPGAQTVVTEQVDTTVEEQRARLVVLEEMPTVAEVASALNALGVTPRDMMTIFQMIKQAGALQAELVLQ